MNGCEGCKEMACLTPCCEFCGIGECSEHAEYIGYIQAMCTRVCHSCANSIMDELQKYNWTTYP